MSHRACCHTCCTVQLMHYSHFKTQSLQHLKPIKCQKRVCMYKTPTCFGLFSRPSSGCPPLCLVPLPFLSLICVRWVRITQYVAACVCHLCVFGVLDCWWSACELSVHKHVLLLYYHLYQQVSGLWLRSWVRIPPGARIFVCCECRVLSGRGLCYEVFTSPEEFYRLCCVVLCDLETSRICVPCIYIHIWH
jgi:hypothetical protein